MQNEYRIDTPKKPGIKIVYLAAGLLVAVFLAIFIYYFTNINKAASSESVPVDFTVEKGSSTGEIAEKLESEKVINSSWVFKTYVIAKGAGSKIQAGEYMLDRKMSVSEIVDVLTAGKVAQNEKKVTVIEGLANEQIAKNLEQRNITTAAEFKAALKQDYNFKFLELGRKFDYQGFLFPDTYRLSKNAQASELIEKMLKNFESKLTDQMINDLQNNGRNLGDVLILASIIEKEVGRSKDNLTEQDLEMMNRERELVASVFYNRIEIGMPLQSDATVNYVTGKFDRQALIEDTKIQSPYNTYYVKGLPPTPISNPGIDSIKAAINPAESDYLYFLNDIEGKAYFGRSIEEHNENRAKYLD